MPLISHEDYPNRRIYLSIDSVGVNVHPIEIYREHRARRQANANGEQNFLPLVFASGNEQIGPAKFTPRFTDLASGVKLVPYDTTHSLLIRGALISKADSLEGRDLFDRSSLLSSVDIDYQPPQVEIITVSTGSGLSTEQDSKLSSINTLATRLTSMLENVGHNRWSTESLENVSATLAQSTLDDLAAILEAVKALVDGKFVVDYSLSTATQYNAGDNQTPRTVFDLRQADGATPATSATDAVQRIPQE